MKESKGNQDMPYFLFDGILKEQEAVRVEGDESAHIREARRIRVGEVIQLQDQEHQRYDCELVEVHKKYVVCLPLKKVEPPAESSLCLKLIVSVVKEKPMDLILQKCTELGVTEIHVVSSDYSKSLPEGKQLQQKMERWNRIMLEACKQSERKRPPLLTADMTLAEAYAEMKDENLKMFFLHPGDNSLNLDKSTEEGVALFIGPEGGFSEEELEDLEIQPFSLGERILRTETAVLASVSIFQHLLGDLK